MEALLKSFLMSVECKQMRSSNNLCWEIFGKVRMADL